MEPVRLHATLDWLLDATADLQPGQNLGGTLEHYLERLLEGLGAEQGSIMLREEDGLSIVASRGLSEEVRPGMRVGLTDGPAGEVLTRGEARVIQGEIGNGRQSRPDSSVIIPIRARQQIYGVLNVGRLRGAAQFTEDEVQAISVVAAQLAWLLSNFELMSKMWHLAVTDELTGLHNRRYFNLRFQEEIQRAQRYGNPLSLVMLDLDGFKEVNRSHGHLTADGILQQVCTVVRRSLRGVDVVARYGGDEVVTILPETTIASALALIGRLQARVAGEVFGGDNGAPVRLTLSAGLAAFPEDGDTPEALVRQADKALLQAKERASGSLVVAAELVV